MDTMQTIFRSAKVFFCATFLSRCSGFLRDMAMAFSFGSSPEVGAFLVAFRLAHLFRRLLGEGNVQSGFVPQFEAFRQESFERAVHFYREAAFLLTALSALVILAAEVVLWSFLGLLSPSWREIALLTMWMLPGLLFICLSGMNQALLQAQKKYFWPAAAPIAFNGAWIAVALFAKEMQTLAIGVTLGCALQWAVSSWQVRKEFLEVCKHPRSYFSPACRQLLRAMTLGLVGVAASQVNSALDAIFARMADLSGPVYLWYATRIQQLPLALFGLALSGALLPALSRAIQGQQMGQFQEFFQSSLRRAAALSIPSTFGLIALGGAGLNLLYGHGHFSPEDVQHTLECLWAYSFGLVPSVLVLLFSQAFYAQALHWIPARASFISVLVNMALNALFVFVFQWGSISIALATSISAMLNAYLLMRGSVKESIDASLLRLYGRLTIVSSLAALLTLLVQYGVFGGLGLTSLDQGVQCAVLGALYIGAVWGLSQLFSVREISELLT